MIPHASEPWNKDSPESKASILTQQECDRLADKWKMLPLFLKSRGLLQQHIESFDYFCEVGINELVTAKSNYRFYSEVCPKFYFEYKRCYLGKPSIMEGVGQTVHTPQLCRIRDLTYAADIFVDVEYIRGNETVTKRGLCLGRLPVMLKSRICSLYGKTPAEIIEAYECPYDPGGYFIVRGAERILFMQEQMSAKRINVEYNTDKTIVAVVTSNTTDKKFRTTIMCKPQMFKRLSGSFFLKHFCFTDPIPVVIVLNVFSMASDVVTCQHIGSRPAGSLIAPMKDALREGVNNRSDALVYLGKGGITWWIINGWINNTAKGPQGFNKS